jgi:hypothetical protein
VTFGVAGCKKGQQVGPFHTAQELHNVKGVGEKNFQKLQPHILVGEAPARAAAAK